MTLMRCIEHKLYEIIITKQKNKPVVTPKMSTTGLFIGNL